MISGFNHNLKYKGRVYHVQTEDGGEANPCIVTHAFLGGVILDTVRQPYDDILGEPNWRDLLRDRMKAQHLEQIRRLYSGALDSGPGAPAGDD